MLSKRNQVHITMARICDNLLILNKEFTQQRPPACTQRFGTACKFVHIDECTLSQIGKVLEALHVFRRAQVFRLQVFGNELKAFDLPSPQLATCQDRMMQTSCDCTVLKQKVVKSTSKMGMRSNTESSPVLAKHISVAVRVMSLFAQRPPTML
jgi:hypothetical protein